MTLVDHSDDLTRLIQEEYDLEIREMNLLVHRVPYLNSSGEVEYGILVSELTTNGERTVQPGGHDIYLVGGVPYDHQRNVVSIVIDQNPHDFGEGLVASCRLSGKPGGRMPNDYHEKISNYVRILSSYAHAVDPTATHKNVPVRESSPQESVFRYHDAATSRSGLSAVTGKLKLAKVAIVGLGGTGSYILDQVVKTPVAEIHLYDDDVMYAHNAFRSPGAATLDELKAEPLKVDYLFQRYDPLHRNIIKHSEKVTKENVDQLNNMSFVFLAMDSGPDKRLIVEQLQVWGISFVDCGMGLRRHGNSLRGVIRVTAGIQGRYGHLDRRISYTDINEDEYDLNIQTGDLNMLNAALAVIKWKKICGYYVDTKDELNSSYTVGRNQLISGEPPG